MGEVGILRDDERVELIYGEVVAMNPIGGRQAACVRGLNWFYWADNSATSSA